jgi:hypothetical protein
VEVLDWFYVVVGTHDHIVGSASPGSPASPLSVEAKVHLVWMCQQRIVHALLAAS